MRIGYDHTAFVRQRAGGIARYFCELTTRLARREFVRAFLGLHLVDCAGDLSASADAVGLGRPDLPKTHRMAMAISDFALTVMSARWNVDVYHATGDRFKSLGRASRQVITIFDCIPERVPGQFEDVEAMNRRKRETAREADAVICISETTRRDALEFLDVPEPKISVTRLAAGIGAAPRGADPVGRPYLLYVGRRRGYKNARVLLEALARAELPVDPVLVFFGGEKPDRSERRRIRELGLADRVEYRRGDDKSLATLYNHARVLVVTSTYEGFGLPLLEAMKYGCPVVCSDRGALPEVAGRAALFFDPSSVPALCAHLKSIFDDSDLRRELRNRGLAREKAFSWRRCADETLACYRGLL